MIVCRSVGSAVMHPTKDRFGSSATYARMPLPVSSSSTTAASSTGPLSAAAAQRGESDQGRREAALHVGGAAAVDPPVANLPAERIGRPPVTNRHDVRVPEQQQPRSPAPLLRRHPLRPVDPGKRDGDVVAAGLDRACDHVEPELPARRGEDRDRRRLLAGRVLSGRPQQLRGDPHQQVLVDPIQHGLLGGRHVHAALA